MSRNSKIIAFSGSIRKESLNKKLLHVAVDEVRRTGAEVTQIDLREFPLPIYDGDLEAESGVPENACELRRLMMGSDGFLIASPEYNGSVPGLLKNTLDWCSRPAGDGDALAPYRGKVVALLAASISPFGGVRGIGHLRAIMGKMGSLVLAEDVALPFANKAFDAEGRLTDPGSLQIVRAVSMNFADVIARLNGLTLSQGAGQAGSQS
jgi:chromate reductase, NAD(P)H dehydrogenase (quinone)